MNGLIEHFRNIMTVIITKKSDLIEEADFYKKKYLEYLNKFSEGDLLRILAFLNKVQYELRSSSNQKLKIEISLCHLIGLEKSSTISELISKIGKQDSPSKGQVVSDFSQGYSTSPKQVNSSISNVRPVKKEEIVLPEITSFVPPSAENSEDLNEMIAKWRSFVEQVQTDKMFFGSILLNASLVSYTKDQIHIEVEHPEDEDIITENKTYLDKKTKEIFGEKIDVKVSKEKKSAVTKKSTTTNHSSNSTQADADPIANAIINDLGGREIKR